MSTVATNHAAAFAALADPVRRRLYRAAIDRALGRDEAAELLGIPRSTAAFHLDRLTEAGLLTVTFERPPGRSGPGAGRPAKRYRAVAAEIAGTLPERHYELAGELLAAAVERAEERGIAVRAALSEEAFSTGAAIGAAHDDLDTALVECGYEPRTAASGDTVLDNCPFHVLARAHTPLICGANLDLVRGLAAATGDTRTPVLAPRTGYCCVALRRHATE
ncbi:helix-turn-helix transcriptional regulator [Microbacterium invictum]|uniref:ArsR family transcriptional regulator n=1 Tax=Microbacterium invictum TaxID=515415 RepID=A0AA40SLL7_9MICO|nr:helix-turn-helix domain-containing protein [Microbacterium invictum]MBB4138500.1 putative ArsR family transcriptional regulator [Microbacterium invictum]